MSRREDSSGSLFPDAEAPREVAPRGDAPLAARMRPRTLDEILGQDDSLGPGTPLRRAIEADALRSLILWGPPGSGKTTLAHVIRRMTRAHFEAMSAVLSGVKELREVLRDAVPIRLAWVSNVGCFRKRRMNSAACRPLTSSQTRQ